MEPGPGEASSQGSVISDAQSLGPSGGDDGEVGDGEVNHGEVGDGEVGGPSVNLGQCKKRGKRKKTGFSKHKRGAKSRGQEDAFRRKKVTDKIEKIKNANHQLRNPYDDMDIDTKREHAIFLYCEKMTGVLSDFEVAFASKSVSVKKKVAKRVGVSCRTMRKWVLEYWSEEDMKKSKRGRHSKVESPIDDIEFKAAFCQYVRAHAKPKGDYIVHWTIS